MKWVWSVGAGLSITLAVVCERYLLPHVSRPQWQKAGDVGGLLLLYGGVLLTLICAGVCCNFLSKRERSSSGEIDCVDIVWALVLSAVAVAIRCQGPVTGAIDEVLVFSETMTIFSSKDAPITGISPTSYPYIIHWIVAFVLKALGNQVEAFKFHKILSILSSSLSIGVWYFLGRLYFSRSVAFSSSMLLSAWGWHYVNSRFLYVYPHDLLAISVGVLCSVLAFRNGRALAAVGLGLVWAYALVARKVSIMLLPFSAYVFIEHACSGGWRRAPRTVALLAVSCICFLFAFAPWIVAHPTEFNPMAWHSRSGFFRYQQAFDAHRSAATDLGGGRLWTFGYIFLDAFRQFWWRSYDQIRHQFVVDGAILDPVFSLLFAVGLVVVITKARSQAICRILLVGLIVFIAPMVLSYPLDSARPQGMARRMIGVAVFVALVAAIGAERLASIFVRPAWRAQVVIALCAISVFLNGYTYVTRYLKQPIGVWAAEHGVQRAADLLTVRDLARTQELVLIHEDLGTFPQGICSDLQNIKMTQSRVQIRELIKASSASSIAVVIPASTKARPWPTEIIMMELSDIIPRDSWQPGTLDVNKEPLVYVSKVRGVAGLHS